MTSAAEIAKSSFLDNARRAVNVIIRPPRATYFQDDPNDDLPPNVIGIPISFRNRRRQNIIGCLYVPPLFTSTTERFCVLYLHGNVGSQREGSFLARYLIPRGISLFCFDFSGSGLSDGEFVRLGHHEHEDVLDAINLLKSQFRFTGFVLWGRSMGAACALMAAPRSNLIRGIIVDSAYASVNEMFADIAEKLPIPGFMRGIAIWWVKREVWQRAHFDCGEVNPALIGREAKVPLLLGHALDDELLSICHADIIFKEYGGRDKEMVRLTGGHNGARSMEWLRKCLGFVLRTLGVNREVGEIEESNEIVEHVASLEELVEKSE
jgi:pimeloyl-ACP methyl ester carboxylesterase